MNLAVQHHRVSRWAGLVLAVAAVLLGTCRRPSNAVDQPVSHSWQRVHVGTRPGENTPSAGEDYAMAYDESRGLVFVYGGKDDRNMNRNDLWAFSLESRLWQCMPCAGSEPPPREDHTLVWDRGNDALILYGGEDGRASRETWSYDLNKQSWKNITDESAPFGQTHVAAYDPHRKRMIVFGRLRDQRKRAAQTWTMNLDQSSPEYCRWTIVDTGEPTPGKRAGHAGVYDSIRQRLIILAGQAPGEGPSVDHVWALDLKTDRWSKLNTRGEAPPTVRQTAACFDQNRDQVLLFGGEVHSTIDGEDREFLVNRSWVLDINSLTWTDCTPYPPARFDHIGVFVPEWRGVFTFGGSSHQGSSDHSSWLLRVPQPASDQVGNN